MTVNLSERSCFYFTHSSPAYTFANTEDFFTFFLSESYLPVELSAFDKRVGVSISNDHIAAHASEAFRMILLLSSNLFICRAVVYEKHNTVFYLNTFIWATLNCETLELFLFILA